MSSSCIRISRVQLITLRSSNLVLPLLFEACLNFNFENHHFILTFVNAINILVFNTENKLDEWPS